MKYFHYLNSYLLSICWLGSIVDLMTFHMLDFKEADVVIRDKIDRDISVVWGKGRRDLTIGVFTSCKLYL